MITTQYWSGQPVTAREYGQEKWRPARVTKPAPYPNGNCDGAYIVWTDMPTPRPMWLSEGGWQPAHSIRAV